VPVEDDEQTNNVRGKVGTIIRNNKNKIKTRCLSIIGILSKAESLKDISNSRNENIIGNIINFPLKINKS